MHVSGSPRQLHTRIPCVFHQYSVDKVLPALRVCRGGELRLATNRNLLRASPASAAGPCSALVQSDPPADCRGNAFTCNVQDEGTKKAGPLPASTREHPQYALSPYVAFAFIVFRKRFCLIVYPL